MIWFIESNEPEPSAKVFRQPSGHFAAAAFSTLEAALQFIEAKGLRDKWCAHGKEGPAATVWVKALPGRGVDFIVYDQPADEEPSLIAYFKLNDFIRRVIRGQR